MEPKLFEICALRDLIQFDPLIRERRLVEPQQLLGYEEFILFPLK